MDYEVYQDESTPENGGYWHGLLFVPLGYKDELVTKLKDIRASNSYPERKAIVFRRLHTKNGEKFKTINQSLQLFSRVVISQTNSEYSGMGPINGEAKFDGQPLGKEYTEITEVEGLTGVRFQLLREKDSHKKMTGHRDHASKIETTFRFALNSGMHFLFDNKNSINLIRVHFDGYEHLRRNINPERILDFKEELRPYATVDASFDVDDRHGRTRNDDSFIIMNFIDNVISGWRCLIMNSSSNEAQRDAVYPLQGLWDRWQDGLIVKNSWSRWRKSICLTECFLTENGWEFGGMFGIRDDKQLKLF